MVVNRTTTPQDHTLLEDEAGLDLEGRKHRGCRFEQRAIPEDGAGADIERRLAGAAAVALDADDVWIARDGHHLAALARRADRRAAALAGSLEAPMPGTVLLVHVRDGDAVAEGDVLLVLESMKMELAITAPRAGTVDGLALVPGDRVTHKQPLLAIAP